MATDKKNKPKLTERVKGLGTQIRSVYDMSKAANPNTPLILLAVFLGVMVLFGALGLLFDLFVYFLVLGLPVAVLATTFTLGRIAQKAAYTQVEGQPGQAGAVLQALGRGWWYEQEPVAAEMPRRARSMNDMSGAAMVFRGVSRRGVLLVAEGPKGPAQRMLTAQEKQVHRIAGPEVPVTTYLVGSGEDRTRLSEVVQQAKKLPKQITEPEAEAVHRRLTAMGGISKQAGMPKGVDPQRMRTAKRSTIR
ncbi:protein of unknown function [Kytococcus aerolatus]|uniref:DUF4191 domain-containing protein n=1 Tax=Kytococcus aerolatus TaxID=592308 RepID=A0A212T483_9MICO|nr:DUF4191 domain-containing protein [Kytococcus aerolatus]SNC60829.1 protein of unknown function [Kytococcus aerolatus]